MACAIDCLSWWRKRGEQPGDLSDEGEAEVSATLSAIRPRLAALDSSGDLPAGLLSSVDGVIGQELEDQWDTPEADVPRLSDQGGKR